MKPLTLIAALAFLSPWPGIGAKSRDWPSEREDHRDEITGAEVWRLTSHSEVDIATHRLRNCWSPDGSTILFRSERAGILHLFLMPADGSKITRLDDLKGSAKYGAWSRTGREVICTRAMHETGFEIHAIDAATLTGHRITGPFEAQLGPFSLSPDGQSILFTRFIPQPADEKQDVIKSSFVNMDGTGLFTFEKITKHGSFAWIPGRMDLLRLKSSRQQYIAQPDGSGLRLLAEGGHEWFTPDGRRLLVCDPKGGDPSQWLGKCSAGIYDIESGERRDVTRELTWLGSHPSIDPTGRFVAVDNAGHSYPGAILILSLDGSVPLRVLCYHHASWESGHITHPTMHWSPDGTKIVFVSDKDSADKKKGDLYLTVVAPPEAPDRVHVNNRPAGPLLTWRPAPRHVETKEFVVMRSVPSPRPDRSGRKLDRTGVFEEAGVVPVVSTHLAGEHLGAKAATLNVESTEAFPKNGQLLIAGNHSMATPEIVTYAGKTETSFLNCERGTDETAPAPHWSGARVWSLGAMQFTEKLPDPARLYYYTVRAREHSGLESPYSRISNAALTE